MVTIGVGDRAYTLAIRACTRFLQTNPGIPAVILTERVRAGGIVMVKVVDDLPDSQDWVKSRNLKVRLPDLIPWDDVLYTDADMMVNQDLSHLWGVLEAGWDVAIVPSSKQDRDAFWHVNHIEVAETLERFGTNPLQLQGGMFLYHRSPATLALFTAWHGEWSMVRGKDQAALVRALHRSPTKVWLLGRPFNGGAAVAHRWGEISRVD